MFKGIIRIIISYFLILFSLVLGISLWGFSFNDSLFYSSDLNTEYQNVLGALGNFVAMPFTFFYGKASWIWAIFSLFIGIRLLTGIDPKMLLIRFGIAHYLALMLATLLSLVTNGVSFIVGGLFGSLIVSILTSFIPHIVWVPFVLAGVFLGAFSIWNFPHYLLQTAMQLVKNKLQPTLVTVEPAPVIEEEPIITEYSEEVSSEPFVTKEKDIEEFYESYNTPPVFNSQVPEFLQEVDNKADDDNYFLSKKPIILETKSDFLRDADFDLLSPYMNNDNPLYDKIDSLNTEESTNDIPAAVNTIQEIVESIDDLDQSTHSLVPNSQWVRESGVSIKDFVRKPIQRLSFDALDLNDSEMHLHTKESHPESSLEHKLESFESPSLAENSDVLTSLINHDESLMSDEFNHEEEIPQHISNFPPVSSVDNTLMLIPEMDAEGVADPFTLEINDSNHVNISAVEMTESEKMLVNGVERTAKKQEDKVNAFRTEIREKQQKLAQQYYQQHGSPSVDEIFVEEEQSTDYGLDTISPSLTTSFALQDFQQEIQELSRINTSDTVSHVLGDDVFLHLTQPPELPKDDQQATSEEFLSSTAQDLVDEALIQELMLPVVDESVSEDTSDEEYIQTQQIQKESFNKSEDTKTEEIITEIEDVLYPQEDIIEQQLSEDLSDYQSPQFASLIRLELGDVSLPDITELTIPVSTPTMINSTPLNDLPNEKSLESWNENQYDKNLDTILQDFQYLDTSSTQQDTQSIQEEYMTVSSFINEDTQIVNFDDIISKMESQINTYEDKKEVQTIESDIAGETIFSILDVDTTDHIDTDSFLPKEQEEVISIYNDLETETEKLTEELELETEEIEEELAAPIFEVEEQEELPELEYVVEEQEELTAPIFEVEEQEELPELEYVVEEQEELTAPEYVVEEQEELPELEYVVEEQEELTAPEYVVEEQAIYIPETPSKEIILNNTEYLNQNVLNDTAEMDFDDELDESESALMPSVVTEGHMVKSLEYPIDKNEEFIFPSIEDLDPNTDQITKELEDEEIENTMKMIEDTYESFNINMQVVDYNRGPTITRFELEPPSGLKLRTILNLQDDLALQAGTSNLRIISPVEGRSLIGIEVPNKVRRNFLIREQIESSMFEQADAELPLILGVDVGGKEIVGDLATTPHLLIAGTTGSGKSVYVNALIMGLLFKLSAEDLKFIMIDPKMVELELYSGIPHLLAPIITKPEEAMAALEWAVQEMDRRYKLLSELGVRNIKEYKTQAKDSTIYEKLPYIVIIVDEFANLMLRAPKDTEKHISRLASMSRAVGIHLVLATQRPSVDVVTGVIKANFPSRIALRVSSKIDSRTIIDRNGAETLLGRGDMLFMSPNYMEPIRIQSPFASSEDVARTVMRIKKNGAPDYAIDFSEVLAKQDEDNSEGSRTDAMSDSLFEEVLRFAVDNGEVSASGIQRRFRVGYNRASRLIETMKDLKIISPPPSAGKGWMINITRDEIFKYID